MNGMIRLLSPMAMVRAPTDQLALDAAWAAVMALDVIGMPAAAIGRNGRAVAVNPRFKRLVPDAARKRADHLQLVGTAADAVLGDTLARLASDGERDGARLIAIPPCDGQPPMIMHYMPVRGAARDVLPGVRAMLVVVPLLPKEAPGVAVLQRLFQLTPAEARVAQAVAQRQTINEIADRLGLSQETVRTQLKAVLAKTGVKRKLDLAVMLAGANLPAATEPRRRGAPHG
jgi:DNA-binding CsgD family transcriptional regulator